MNVSFRSLVIAAWLGAVLCARADEAPSPEPTVAPAPAEAPLETEHLLRLLAQDLQTRFSLEGELQLECVGAWAQPERVARDWRVLILEYPAVASGSMLVRFRILADGAALKDTTLMLRAALWRNAWYAREPLGSGITLETSQLEARRIDCFRTRDAIPAGRPDTDFVTGRAISAGSLLTWHDVTRRPLVRKGEMVEVSASQGLLKISMKALALQSGARGEIVTIRNPESLKTIPAQVVAENRVEVRL